MSEILRATFPENTVAVLSGPNLAVEVSRGLPTATVLGCDNSQCAEALQHHLGSARFRIYSSEETVGIELGGALKNIFAIPAGVSDGIGLGDNSKAALVTRALAELLRLGTAMGGQPAHVLWPQRRGRSSSRPVSASTAEIAGSASNSAGAERCDQITSSHANGGGRNPDHEKRLRMRAAVRSRNADHRSGLRRAL